MDATTFNAMSWQHLKSLKFPDLPLDEVDRKVLDDLAERLQDNYPYNQQNYAGQMIASSYACSSSILMSTLVNPNNHAPDGGRATSALELEIMAEFRKDDWL